MGDAETVEAIAGWDGRTGVLANALADCGFVESEGAIFRLVGFDWMWSRSTRVNYGSDWRAVRDGIVERDGGACARCGSDRRLEVHHRRPIILFGGDVDSANRPDNLVTLCRPCHRAEDNRLRSKRRAH